MKNKVLIISGGPLEEEFALERMKSHEGYTIAADKGLAFFYRHKELYQPDYAVGDFDSLGEEIRDYYKNETNVPVRECNPVKDASDTEIAIRLAMAIGGKEIEILGATGGRIDHLWANVQTLMIPFRAGIKATILDSRNSIQLIERTTILKKEECFGSYFSLFSLGGEVNNLTIEGAKYPLSNYTLVPDSSLCVSNCFADESEEVLISYTSGIMILMETRD